jgi:sulfur transfer complex TusBCD TusB component (DsrH family)
MPKDETFFAVPDDFHARGLERFLTGLSAVP